ncbi:MAG TPA: lysylphosphatidylglycerol synthase domain-containing protein [Stellaceae bacterium]|nr:lysylphosphatidylglycerol synthase domain-containing protein [Stellaceae bacterium]
MAHPGSRRDTGEPTRRSRLRRRLAVVLMIGGFGLMAWLITHFNSSAIVAALRAAGARGLLAICGFHLIVVVLMGFAWWNLLRLGKPQIFVWGRLVRDAGSEVLPLSQIGGYILGARAAVLQGVRGTAAAASMVVDATVEFCAQIAFVGVGLALLLSHWPNSTLALPVMVGLVAAGAAVGTFIAIQRTGPDMPLRGVARLLRNRAGALFSAAASVRLEIRRIHGSNLRLGLSFLLHFCAWMASGMEAWVALRLMGVSLSPVVVLTIESLLYATRSLTFLVPASLGVQEGAYVVLGSALGLTPDVALALSLLKRGRDLALGVPALVSWQLFETHAQRRIQTAPPSELEVQRSALAQESGCSSIRPM